MSSRPSRGAARLASILDALPDALLLVDVNGTVVNANAIALETFESPGTALVGRGLLDLLPGFDSKRIPGSMRSPREAAEESRTKPTRMVARRTDGTAFPVEVTSANLENGRSPYAEYGDGVPHYTGDELLMLVVRDLQHTVDTEAELARQQRQTEMILRAAAEGVVGVDTAGKVVLVNPSAAQILGHRATDLGGKELHPLVHHSRADGSPLPYEETPLADTLRSGRKHRVRGQVLWRKDGRAVPVDLTTAPVRDGDQLVGAVMTFTDRTGYDALAARARQLSALLDASLRGPLNELRGELTGLAADPAGQLWPEANQILHHLSAGYARITTLIDNVLAFQRLDRGEDKLQRAETGLDEVVNAAVEGAIELIGPGRAQYAVHAPPITASVDAPRMAQALAHLIADVAGVDSAGNATAFSGDSTIVVAAAKRGDRVRIDVRGPHAGGDPVHLPLARGIVERHGGVLQTHEVPGQGSAYVLEVPSGTEPGAPKGAAAGGAEDGGERSRADGSPGGADPSGTGSDRRSGTGTGARTSMSADGVGAGRTGPGTGTPAGTPGAEAPRPPRPRQAADDTGTIVAPWAIPAAADQTEAPTGRRRALRRPEEEGTAPGGEPEPGDGVPPTGRRARRARPAEGPDSRPELPAPPIPNALPAAESGTPNPPEGTGRRARRAIEPPAQNPPGGAAPDGPVAVSPQTPRPAAGGPAPADASGRRAVEHPPHRRQPESGWPAPAAPTPGVPSPAPVPPSGDPGNRAPWPPAAQTPGVPSPSPAPSSGDPGNPAAWPPAAQTPDGPAQTQAPSPGGPANRAAWPPAARTPGVPGPTPAPTPGEPGNPAAWPPATPTPGDPAQTPVPPSGEPGNRASWPPAAQAPGVPGPTPAPTHGEPGNPASWPPAAQTPGAPSPSPAPTPGDSANPSPWPATPTPENPAQTPAPAPQESGWPAPAAPTPGVPAPVPPSGEPANRPALPERPTWPNAPQNGPANPPAAGARPPGQDPQPQGGNNNSRAISVRTLGQGVPFAIGPNAEQTPTQAVQAQSPQGLPPQVAAGGSGRRRRLAPPAQQPPQQPPGPQQPESHLPNQDPGPGSEAQARQHPQADPDSGQLAIRGPEVPRGPKPDERGTPRSPSVPSQPGPAPHAPGRSYAIGAPAAGAAEGPEPLDGPNGAVDVTDVARVSRTTGATSAAGTASPADPHNPANPTDDHQEEPLDEPRRLLVWPEPDVSTRQALTERGYRPVIVRSREEVDAQVAEPPAALFVDPLTGPITRTALQSLRQAAAAADVPVLVTAGLGQATREAAYGADPAVLLKALAPRDSEQHPPRVLLVESHEPIAQAFSATLERRGMQVAHAGSEADAMTKAAQIHPNLVVMDLMLIHRRRQGIVDWLRAHARLKSTPLVVYTSADIDPAELPRLASGETVLFLAERSTSTDVQSRIVDLLGKIGG